MNDAAKIIAVCRPASGGGLSLNIKVIPSASASAVSDVLEDGRLKIKIAAAPEDGKANAALIQFIAKKLKIPKSTIKIVKGEHCREKTLFLPEAAKIAATEGFQKA